MIQRLRWPCAQPAQHPFPERRAALFPRGEFRLIQVQLLRGPADNVPVQAANTQVFRQMLAQIRAAAA